METKYQPRQTKELRDGKILELYCGNNEALVKYLFKEWNLHKKGYIPSEKDIESLRCKDYQLFEHAFNSSDLYLIKGNELKIVHPYKNGSNELTPAAKIGFRELLYKIGNIRDQDLWERLEGEGVYTFDKRHLILNRSLTKDEAIVHPLILNKLGHSDYVDKDFAKTPEEVSRIIDRKFEMVNMYHQERAMKQSIDVEVPDNKIAIYSGFTINKENMLSRMSSGASKRFGDYFYKVPFIRFSEEENNLETKLGGGK